MNAQDHARFQSLYQRYLTELTLWGKSDKPIDLYARCLRQISEYFDTCPDQLGTDQLQQYFRRKAPIRPAAIAAVRPVSTAPTTNGWTGSGRSCCRWTIIW